jgi:hypothetical protein
MKGRVAGAPVTKADGGHRAAVPRRDPARRLARAIGNRAFAGLAQRSVARVQSGEVDALLQYGLAEEGYTNEDVQRDIDEEWQRVEQARAGRETVGFIDQEIGFDLATLGFEEIEPATACRPSGITRGSPKRCRAWPPRARRQGPTSPERASTST